MRVSRRLAVLSATVVTAASLTAVAQASPDAEAALRLPLGASPLPTSWAPVPVDERLQPWLAGELAKGGSVPLPVLVSGETTALAQQAAAAAGLRVVQVWDKVGIVVATGLPAQVRAVVGQPGVRDVSGDEPLAYTLDTAHRATRADQALEQFQAPGGSRIDGSGVSVAVIDSGIDGTHPFFQQGGESKVVANLKNACGIELVPQCFQQNPANDTDTMSGGGHGTHVAGIVAGVETTTTMPAGTKLRGAAPGAKLVGLSVGAAIGLLDAAAAMNWVVEHQRKPCADSGPAQDGPIDPECPPIRATNHSYGPVTAPEGGFTFDETDPSVTLQRTLVAQGVTVNWAAGNSDGDGSTAETNPPAMDPTPGVVMVASYDDGQTGNRDNILSDFSSRGAKGKLETYPDVSAPGSLITSSCRPALTVCNGTPAFDTLNYQTISGTSMATPYVAGVVALLTQADPDLTPGEIEDLLEDTAHEFGTGYEADPLNADSQTSFDKGHGLVDVLAVLARRQGLPDPDAPAALCPPGSAQLTDPEGDATQVFITDVPGGPSQRDLDIREARLTFDGTSLRVAVRLSDVDPAASGTDEYLRIALARTGDPVVDIVAQRDTLGSSFTATSGGDPLDPTAEETSATLTGTFDPATDLVTVVISRAAYAALVPGAVLADGDDFKLGAVLAQRNTGLLTLTADSANGSCGFRSGEPVEEVPVDPSATPTASTSPSPSPDASPSGSPDPGTSPGPDTTRPTLTTSISDPVTEDDTSVVVSGAVQDASSATVTVTLTDGVTTQPRVVVVPAGESRAYTVTFPASAFSDGTLTATAQATDAAGNTGAPVTDTGQKDTVGVDVLTAAVSPDPVTATSAAATTVSGTIRPTADSDTATVTVLLTGPGGSSTGFVIGTAVVSPGQSAYRVTVDVSGLPDGTLTATVSAVDDVRNDRGSDVTDTADKNARGPVVTTTISPDPVTPSTTSITVSGRSTDVDTATVTIVLSDGARSEKRTVVVAAGGGDYAVGFPAAGFADGTLTATATAVDTIGNTGRATDTADKGAATAGPSTSPSPSPSVSASSSLSPSPSGSPSPSTSPVATLGRFHPVTPARVLDTRTGTRVAAGSDRTVKVTGVGGVPATGVSSVVLNVTVTQATRRGDLQVSPTGQRPGSRTSNLNFSAGETVPVQVLTGVGANGEIDLSVNTGSAQVIVDVFGWYGDSSDRLAGSSGFTPLQPQRLLDTRTSRTPVTAGADRTVVVGGRLGVPTGATAVVLNTTVLGTPGNADLQVSPTGARPTSRTSNLNVRRGQTKANSVTVQLGSNGSVDLSVSQASAHVVLDVLGYYSADSRGRFIPLTPARVLDTRASTPPAPLRAGADRAVTVTGRGGVPAGAAAAVLSVTGTGASNPVDLQVFPTGDRPGRRTSTLNVRPGEAVANLALATAGTGGQVTLSLSQGSAAVILDAVGYITND